MRADLTLKQQEFLKYLRGVLEEGRETPSLRQAAVDLGVSHAAVAQLIRALEEKGYIRREGRYSRVIHLLNRAGEALGLQRWREVPVIGRVQAGLPMYAQQEWESSLVLDREVFRGENLFALRVKGDSMKDAGILAGDYVVCEPRQFAANGEIVVALVNNEEATVKYFFIHSDHIELRSANPAFAPMWYDFGEILLQGKVIGLQRGPEQMKKL